MLYKYLFSIHYGHLNLNKKMNLAGHQSNRSVSRSEPIEHAILNLTGFRSNQFGKLLPDRAGLTGPVGLFNPGSPPHRADNGH